MDLIAYYQMIAPFKMAALRAIASAADLRNFTVTETRNPDNENDRSIGLGYTLRLCGHDMTLKQIIDSMNAGVDPFDMARMDESMRDEKELERIKKSFESDDRKVLGEMLEEKLNDLLPISSKIDSYMFGFDDEDNLVMSYTVSD